MNHLEPSQRKESDKESLGSLCCNWMGPKGKKSHTEVITVLSLLLLTLVWTSIHPWLYALRKQKLCTGNTCHLGKRRFQWFNRCRSYWSWVYSCWGQCMNTWEVTKTILSAFVDGEILHTTQLTTINNSSDTVITTLLEWPTLPSKPLPFATDGALEQRQQLTESPMQCIMFALVHSTTPF